VNKKENEKASSPTVTSKTQAVSIKYKIFIYLGSIKLNKRIFEFEFYVLQENHTI